MRRFLIPLILFLLLVLEGVALELLPYSLVTGELVFVPHWVFAFLVMIALFYDGGSTYTSVIFALIFGLLVDIVYTGVLGGYMFSYGLTVYIIHGLKKLLHGNFYVFLLLGILGLALADLLLFGIYLTIGVTDTGFEVYALDRLLPTVISNFVFLLILYPLTVRWLTNWNREYGKGSMSL